MTSETGLPDETRLEVAALLAELCAQHGISPVPRLEWSTRMRRMLGRAYVDHRMIRLSAWLADGQALHTLRHELAHIAVGSGRQAPHGPKWREWAVRLGVEPRATSHLAPANARQRADNRRYTGLECGNCGVRLARARVLRGLYHRDCGPREGKLRRVVRGGREHVFNWVAAGKSGDA